LQEYLERDGYAVRHPGTGGYHASAIIPASPERVKAARIGTLSAGDAGRLAGPLGMLADPVRSRVLFALAGSRGQMP
jgi:hypothetical protein